MCDFKNTMRVADSSSINVNANSLLIAPNPSNGIVKISLSNNLDKIDKIIVFNIAGNRLTNVLFNINANNEIEIDLSNEAPGVYTLEVLSESQNYHGKIVIQN